MHVALPSSPPLSLFLLSLRRGASRHSPSEDSAAAGRGTGEGGVTPNNPAGERGSPENPASGTAAGAGALPDPLLKETAKALSVTRIVGLYSTNDIKPALSFFFGGGRGGPGLNIQSTVVGLDVCYK